MLAELRRHVPAEVRTACAAFEKLRPRRYGLETGGVFAPFGGPLRPADPAVEDAVRTARAPFLESDEIPSPDGTPPGHALRWPGTELRQSAWFTDIRQSVVERRWAMSASDHLGHLSTVSACPVLPAAEREEVFRRMARVLPEVVGTDAGLTARLARRCEE